MMPCGSLAIFWIIPSKARIGFMLRIAMDNPMDSAMYFARDTGTRMESRPR